jgi:phosphatidylserine/phosphatidylglycerophosphate/cardiolipin synthase-like enzyme
MMTSVLAHHPRTRRLAAAATAFVLLSAFAQPVHAADQIYFPSRDNVLDVLVARINAETERIDMAIWLLTERSISMALVNRHRAGVPIRLLGDRVSIFEADPLTKREFYYLASEGVPIRLRSHPDWFPEINHWKATIFVGQNLVTFGSANYTPFELRPIIPGSDYKDETVMFSDDTTIVNAFKTKFDRMWNDTTPEPRSQIVNPPFLRNWYAACAVESGCADFSSQYPNPAPMVINTARLEPDYALPSSMVWGQGAEFNDRLVAEINREPTAVDFVMYRITVQSVADALIAKHQSGVPVRTIIDPDQYTQRLWPEYWLTHAYVDRMWAAGVPIKQRAHTGLTHMKMLVTSFVATNASSNVAPAWQRDHNYFVPAATKPAIHGAMKDEFELMWNDTSGFTNFTPTAADPATLVNPASNATGVPVDVTFSWNRAPFAVSYDVYVGTSPSNMALVGNVPAILTPTPPTTYSLTASGLQTGTTYLWKVVSRTFATDLNPALIASSPTWSFTTAGVPSGPPPAPSNPAPSNGSVGVSLTPTLGWSGSTAAGITYSVAFGTGNPPPQVASGLSATTYAPGTLSANTTYFWQVTSASSGGATVGPLWSFTTGSGGSAAGEVVIYADDVTSHHGTWAKVADATAAAGVKLRSSDLGAAALASPLANPTNYFDATFQAQAGTRYRVWLRIKAINDVKWNDSVFVQFSDSVNGSGSPVYRIGTPGGYAVNLWTCSECQSIGWGWQRNAYWLADTGDVWFQNTGTHTIRVQVREDGAEIDQIVISPATYLSSAPGPVTGDTTIVPKPGAPPPPPPAPGTPTSPSPVDDATLVSTATALSWSSSNATSYTVRFGTSTPPPIVATGLGSATYSPTLAPSTTYFWRITATNSTGSTTGPLWSFTTAAAPPPAIEEIVVYASDVPGGALHGAWSKVVDGSAAGGVKLSTPDAGFAAAANPLASPAHYVDVTFDATAGTQYRVWLRLRAIGNSKWNDAVWVQFSNARVGGAQVYPINSTSGLLVNLATTSDASSLNAWGWQNGAYWLSQSTLISFGSSGPQTMRIQVREDGVEIDQIVLSSIAFRDVAPGPVTNDSTIVPKP